MSIKYELYRESGVTEYWLVYPEQLAIHQFVLNESTEKYELLGMFSGDGKVSPVLFPELAIDLDDVFCD